MNWQPAGRWDRYQCVKVSASEARASTTNKIMTVSTLSARIGQRNAAEMALRFKALKMGATATQVNLWSLDEVFLFISNHA